MWEAFTASGVAREAVVVPRKGLNRDSVVDAAIAELDANGADRLTLAAVAARCGVAAPSLYKHVRDVGELRALVANRVMDQLTAELVPVVAGRSGYEALSALMRSWRHYVVEHPHRYAAMSNDPLGDPELQAAGFRMLDVLLAVLRGYGFSGDELIHRARCVRAAVHGFVTLEVSGGFGLPEEVEISYERVIHMVSSSLAA
jgi:AcrR family transcriptional regulator